MIFNFNTIRNPDPEVNPGRSITFVEVQNNRGALIGIGEAIKRPDEPFNRTLGFKFAVKDAVKGLPKHVRCKVWHDFFEHSTKTKHLIKQ